MVNETVFFLIICLLPVFTDVTVDPEYRMLVGWAFYAFFGLMFFVSFVNIIRIGVRGCTRNCAHKKQVAAQKRIRLAKIEAFKRAQAYKAKKEEEL